MDENAKSRAKPDFSRNELRKLEGVTLKGGFCPSETGQKRADPVNHPSHYTSGPKCPGCGRTIECIDITAGMGFLDGSAQKYLWRYQLKGVPVEDLKKCRWYIDALIKKLEGEEL